VPEGHTLHRLAREHSRLFAGQRVRAGSPQGRFASGAAQLDGRVVERVEAWGKHYLARFEGEKWLHVHLGLYGGWTAAPLPAPEPRGALRLRLEGEEHYADLRGPTACELWTPPEVTRLIARLGPDPLRPDADPERAWTRISRSRTAVGVLLMNQEVLAGVGNVYRAEVLFRHGVSPYRPGRDVQRAVFEGLWHDLVVLMRAGVRAGHIVTTRPGHRSRRSARAPREDRFYVYRRSGLPCRICGTDVTSADMAARSVYWCRRCQPS
jgi:endonuclease VIII